MRPCADTFDALARELESRRKEKRLSFRDLSKVASVDAGQASRICRGEFATFSENVIRVCLALDVAVPLQGVEVEPEPGMDPRLHAALVAAWDRSPEGTERLIRALDALRIC